MLYHFVVSVANCQVSVQSPELLTNSSATKGAFCFHCLHVHSINFPASPRLG